ncbi:MAG: RES family NAD+ phosphorylase [Spirochaetales bacterium]|nr:RES family NAD+ phosphorylase [Spirochaetales bacterium]
MSYKENPSYDKFCEIMQKEKPECSFSGYLYRACLYDYATRNDLLTGKGALEHGGRYNLPKGFSAVYLSVTPEAALAEYLGKRHYYGIPGRKWPCVISAFDISLQRILDLTSAPVLGLLEISQADLFCDWKTDNNNGFESLTQALGRAARDSGYEGLKYPSVQRNKHVNTVFFRDRMRKSSVCSIVNIGKLPERRTVS